ncbi:hypothetical protein [Kribbella sandramycini]|uniref:Uncharacterized protein n=1 Tax=Kribbella sandramycini TaxID=60450 RepID=A0A841S9I4_9ACTN|nr:hypothetical protein [Kribbella sandramycini]MBB6564786.1 hypothetical protein [Kribbella sandramycini]
MFSNTASVQAEIAYRKERLARDFRTHRTTSGRRTFAHLFTRKA